MVAIVHLSVFFCLKSTQIMVSIFIFVPALLILMTHSQSNMTTTAMTTQPPKLTMDTMDTWLPSEIDLRIGPLIHTDLDNPVSQQGILTVNFYKLICIRLGYFDRADDDKPDQYNWYRYDCHRIHGRMRISMLFWRRNIRINR